MREGSEEGLVKGLIPARKMLDCLQGLLTAHLSDSSRAYEMSWEQIALALRANDLRSELDAIERKRKPLVLKQTLDDLEALLRKLEQVPDAKQDPRYLELKEYVGILHAFVGVHDLPEIADEFYKVVEAVDELKLFLERRG